LPRKKNSKKKYKFCQELANKKYRFYQELKNFSQNYIGFTKRERISKDKKKFSQKKKK
jgi:hypothetical protein